MDQMGHDSTAELRRKYELALVKRQKAELALSLAQCELREAELLARTAVVAVPQPSRIPVAVPKTKAELCQEAFADIGVLSSRGAMMSAIDAVAQKLGFRVLQVCFALLCLLACVRLNLH
jgi:hypothetical protein